MADTFDPYDENDVFDAASLNDRFETLKDQINAVPLEANQESSLGPNHLGSILDATKAQTKVLTPHNAVTADGGTAFFCDPIDKQYPGYLATTFESGPVCWQRIIDSTGGSGGAGLPSTRLEVDVGTLTLGNNQLNALLIMGNVEFCNIYRLNDETPGQKSTSVFSTLVTIVSTVSSTGTRTFHWETLRYTVPPNNTNKETHFSVDVSHRHLLKTNGLDVKTVQILAASLHDWTAATGGDDLHRSYVRFCQLTAVALQAKVN